MTDTIRLAHGNGGKLTQEFVKDFLLPSFKNPLLVPLGDSAVLDINGTKLAFTTDSYVIKPLFFPGGDIGKLAVSGTVNDLVVAGAKPAFISCGLIIEEGLLFSTLKKIVASIEQTTKEVGINVVTGDTKVVEKGGADGLFINTSGIGIISPQINLDANRLQVGDYIIVNGTLGDHSIAVLSSREELGFGESVRSDCAPLYDLVKSIEPWYSFVKFMRDATRGGFAGILNEIIQERNFGIKIQEKNVPISEETNVLCEILGMDPLYLANEGKIVFFVEREHAEDILHALRNHPLGEKARIVGEIVAEPAGKVYLETSIGTKRVLDMLIEDQLPRIC